jgi:hypothetical protein
MHFRDRAESLAESEEVKQLELRVHEAMGTAPEQGHVSFVELHVRPCTLDFASSMIKAGHDQSGPRCKNALVRAYQLASTLQDALTTLRFHQKPLPGTFDTALLDDIEREAARRMLALVAPEDTAGGFPLFPLVSGVDRAGLRVAACFQLGRLRCSATPALNLLARIDVHVHRLQASRTRCVWVWAG